MAGVVRVADRELASYRKGRYLHRRMSATYPFRQVGFRQSRYPSKSDRCELEFYEAGVGHAPIAATNRLSEYLASQP